ncbi:MAG: mycofactocin precursor [SAR324 cluster bacterium]|nr:mycofactocin precursor [SAR324 cluster bacterium]
MNDQKNVLKNSTHERNKELGTQKNSVKRNYAVGENDKYTIEEIEVEELAIDGICGVY